MKDSGFTPLNIWIDPVQMPQLDDLSRKLKLKRTVLIRQAIDRGITVLNKELEILKTYGLGTKRDPD